MSTSNPTHIPATPTQRQESEQHDNFHVFSSPARDVGWSPSAANAPFGGLLYDEQRARHNADVHQIFDPSISPIRRTSCFSLDHIEPASPDATPSAQHGTPGIESGAESNALDETHEPSKDARSRLPHAPPSTPQSVERSTAHPAASLNARPPQFDLPYDSGLGGSPSKSQQWVDPVAHLQSSSTRSRFPPCYPSPEAPSLKFLPYRYPYKPQSVPVFLPPASPTFSAPASTHTFVSSVDSTVPGAKYIAPRSNLPQASPTRTYSSPPSTLPSATPLENDPFLVINRSNNAEGHSSFLLGVRTGIRTGILDDVGYTDAISQITPDAEAPPAAQPHNLHGTLGTRKRNAKMRTTVLDSRARVTKKSNRMSRSRMAAPPTDSELHTASMPPLPSSFFSGISTRSSFTASPSASDRDHYNLLTEPSLSQTVTAPTRDPVSDYAQACPYVPPTLLPASSTKFNFSTPAIDRGSYVNPRTTLRSMFPTPSLTAASFASPSTISDLATPAGAGLFPSPEIITSPSTPLSFSLRPIRGRGRGGRKKVLAGQATPTRIAGSYITRDLVESTSANDAVTEPKAMQDTTGDAQNQRREDNENTTEYSQPASTVGETKSYQGSYGLAPTASPSRSVSSEAASDAWLGKETDVEDAPVQLVDPPAAQDEPSSPSTAKRARSLSVDGDRSPAGTKVAKMESGGISGKGQGNAHSEPISSDFYFERPTRSQARAVAALLALAASSPKDCSRREVAVEDIASQEVFETEISEARGVRARCDSTNETRPASTVKKLRKKGTPNKRAIAGRAPSKVINSTIGTIKLRSRTLTRHASRRGSDILDVEPSLGLAASTSTHAEEEPAEGDEKGAQGEGEVEDTPPTESPRVPGKHQNPSDLLPRPSPSIVYRPNGKFIQRTFPKRFPINEGYSKWYRRFPVSAYFQEYDSARRFIFGEGVAVGAAAIPRAPGSSRLVPNAAAHFNLYTPRFVRGVGGDKVGLCPICVESVWRGGEGKTALYNTKISAYNYHMQYYHGISPRTGLPFSPPTAFRRVKRPGAKTQERKVVEQGKCHACRKWIPIESIMATEMMVPELHWWKHAASCHGTSRLPGDQDPYIEDVIHLRLREYESRLPSSKPAETDASESDASVHAKLNNPVQAVKHEMQADENSSFPKLQVNSSARNGLSLLDTDSDSDLTDLEDQPVDMNISDEGVTRI